MVDAFKHVQNPKMKGLIVWLPMVAGDSALDAANLVSPEQRFVMQAWDSKLVVGKAFSETLKLKCPAWDVYMVFKPGARWEVGNPPIPSFWMHQLGDYAGADRALHLKPAVLEARLRQELDALEHSTQPYSALR